MKFILLPGVYRPAEDTFFLTNIVERKINKGERVVEIGSGSGYISVALALREARVVATDVDPRAVLNTRLNAKLNGVKIRTILSNLFDHVKGYYDTAVFNPPYLEPWEEVSSRWWDDRGVLEIFLDEVFNHAKRFFIVLEEGPLLESVRKRVPCRREWKNAFHLVVVEGFPCP